MESVPPVTTIFVASASRPDSLSWNVMVAVFPPPTEAVELVTVTAGPRASTTMAFAVSMLISGNVELVKTLPTISAMFDAPILATRKSGETSPDATV